MKIVVIPFIFFLLCLFPVTWVYAVSAGPVEPYDLTAVAGATSGSIQVTWKDTGGNGDYYNILYGTTPDSSAYGVVHITRLPDQINQFTIQDLSTGQTYFIKLFGVQNGGAMVESGPVVAQAAITNTTANAPTYYSASKNFEMPYLFALAYGKTPHTIDVNWFDNDSANQYDIVYGTSPALYQYGVLNMPHQENLSNTFTIGALVPGTTYYVALVAKKDGVLVSWSGPLAITVQ